MNKIFETTLKELGPRQVQAIVSTETMDREKDRIKLAGLDLSNYRKNPVVLWAHDYRQPPVAVCREIAIVNGRLQATAEFTAPGINPMADTIHALVKAGAINTTSIGFRPTVSIMNDDGGYNFEQAELLEWSFVPVPANPECLVIARSAGLSDDRIKAFFGGLDFTPELVKQVVTEWVGAAVRREFLKRSDEHVITLSDEMRTAPGHVVVLADEVAVSPEMVRGALREAVPGLVRDAIGRSLRAARGRID